MKDGGFSKESCFLIGVLVGMVFSTIIWFFLD